MVAVVGNMSNSIQAYNTKNPPERCVTFKLMPRLLRFFAYAPLRLRMTIHQICNGRVLKGLEFSKPLFARMPVMSAKRRENLD